MNRFTFSSKMAAYGLLLVSLVCVCAVMNQVANASGEHSHEHGHDREHADEHADEESQGFKLSPEAFKNFGIQLKAAEPGAAMTLPKKAIFFGLQERNLFRYRDGYFKRIDFKTLSKTKTDYTVSSQDFKSGDQIAVEGLGFLRIAELAAFGGVAEGHSH